MKTAEDIGLYQDTPADATVDGFTEDETNPGWAEVSFSDGRKATLPVETAKSMPQTPAAPLDPYGVPQGPTVATEDPGFSAVPQQEPLLPQELAGTGGPGYSVTQPAGGFGEADLVGGVQAAGLPPAPGPADMTGLELAGGKSGLPGARVDPMAEVVSPGSAGGFAPYSESSTDSVTATERAEDPEAAAARTGEAYDAAAAAAQQTDLLARQANARGLADKQAALEEEERQTRAAMLQAQNEKRQHQRVIEAIEKTPIDEDEFWNASPGRAAGAWIALALSGFLQGATRGQNPALNQMVQSLNHAQDRYLQNQRSTRDSKLRSRERLMGDAGAAEQSFRMQLGGIVSKRIDTDAQRASLPPVPGLETYKAQLGVKRAEAMTAIGQTVVRQATEQTQRELRATAATGPVRRGDVVLQQLGVAPKAHADAMDPKGLNLGGVVGGAERLQTVQKALAAIAARNGGQLPSQETVSWSTLGLAPQAARLGIGGGQDEVSVKQLLEEAKLAYKQTVNIKSIDSENEGKNFNAIMDSGEGVSTLDAVRSRAEIANQNALSIASGVTRDPQKYMEFVRGTMHNNPGVQAGEGPTIKSRTGYTVPGGSGEEKAVDATTGGGPAQSAPLAPPAGTASAALRQTMTPESPSAKVSAPGAQPSRPGTYVRLKDRPRFVPR